ncbi:hypothetical protein H712_02379 [Brucella ovis IntaBari-2009-88-4]|nr:hypothetical protein H712_02379 [Brucella ovis IntaBari-2009-88-4]
MRAGMIDQMHIIDAGRACGHAGQAREAAVHMAHDLLIRRAAVFQHVLDEIDAPARAVEFVAERHIGRADRGAETAMHTFAQNLFGFKHAGIAQLFRAEMGLHGFKLQPDGDTCAPD